MSRGSKLGRYREEKLIEWEMYSTTKRDFMADKYVRHGEGFRLFAGLKSGVTVWNTRGDDQTGSKKKF